MKNYIPTIGELLRLPERELNAIFREATCIASDATRTREARDAANRTARNARISLSRPPAP